MDKKYIEGQPSADDTSKIGSKPGLLHTVYVCHSLFRLYPFACFSHFRIFAKDAAREKGYARIPKVTFAACFVTALLAFLFLLAPTAVDLTASFDPPSIELTHLSAEYRKGKDAPSDKTASTPDAWNLSGIDPNGTEHELSIDRDDWERLEKIGTPYDESWDVYRLEFGENVRLVGHWLPGSDKLIDWKVE